MKHVYRKGTKMKHIKITRIPKESWKLHTRQKQEGCETSINDVQIELLERTT